MPDLPKTPHLSLLLELGWEYARDAMFVADFQTGLLVDANPAAERLTGYSRQELIGMHQSLLHPEAERSLARNAFQEMDVNPETYSSFHDLRKDGRIVPVTISSSAVFQADGQQLVMAIHRDISEMEKQEQRLSIKRWALRAYAEAALALGRARSSAGLTQAICEAITHESLFVLAWVGFADEGDEKLIRMAGAAGPALSYMDGLVVSWSADTSTGTGPTGIAFRTNKEQVMNDSEIDECFTPWRERAKTVGIRSSLTMPFQVETDRRGLLVVYASEPNAFGPIVTEAFTHLAEEIGIGLRALEREESLNAEQAEREKAQVALSKALSATVGALTTAFEMRDPYTAGHQSRVAELAYAIGKQMGWQEGRLNALRVASMVHDVGKISVPNEILTKPTRLNQPEWALIKEHAEMGYSILKDIPFHWPIAETVRQHHERLNGSGYPKGLKGDEILIEARILAVADVVESMASSRPYRPALGIAAALSEIERQAGSLLDAEVVRICISLFREKGYVLSTSNLQ